MWMRARDDDDDDDDDDANASANSAKTKERQKAAEAKKQHKQQQQQMQQLQKHISSRKSISIHFKHGKPLNKKIYTTNHSLTFARGSCSMLLPCIACCIMHLPSPSFGSLSKKALCTSSTNEDLSRQCLASSTERYEL